jgi:hypothetical protein
MKKLKVFEAFVDELWGILVFNELTMEEDEKIGEMVNNTLDEFQNDYFEMDEPSTHFNDDENVRADYWLVNKTIKELNILDNIEMDNLNKAYPGKDRKIEYTAWYGKSSVQVYNTPAIYGQFLWYSIKEGRERQYRIWMIAKDKDHLFRAVDAEYATYGRKNTELRSNWDSAKQWDDLDALLASQVSHLKSIGKFIQEHCEYEHDGLEQARREAEAEGDPNAGLEPWR